MESFTDLSDEDKTAIREAVTAAIRGAEEIATSTGAHAGHAPRQVGRCVYCSCGQRFQGYLRNGQKD